MSELSKSAWKVTAGVLVLVLWLSIFLLVKAAFNEIEERGLKDIVTEIWEGPDAS